MVGKDTFLFSEIGVKVFLVDFSVKFCFVDLYVLMHKVVVYFAEQIALFLPTALCSHAQVSTHALRLGWKRIFVRLENVTGQGFLLVVPVLSLGVPAEIVGIGVDDVVIS